MWTRSALLVLTVTRLAAGQSLSVSQTARIDSIVTGALAATGTASAQVAVVWDGRIAYEKAYGNAGIDPVRPATTSTRYSIGSVSKQFTAAAILLLTEQGKLALDDKVGKWLPTLTRADEITIRQLLSMTSGYQDFWPQDYVFPAMLQPVTSQEILDQWASKPLDFDPGSQWQYSNTNYPAAGVIIEKVSGMPLFEFLESRIFTPLGMQSVKDLETGPLTAPDAVAYLRNGLGPLRPAPKEAKGWLFAAGQLAMTAHDLALWDISVIRQSVLRPASYREQQTQVLLVNGLATTYGLGVGVTAAGGRRRLSHGGAVSGYTTQNVIYPDDRAAVVVFTNIYPGAGSLSGNLANRIGGVLFPTAPDPPVASALDQAKQIFAGLQQGRLDRSLFTANANAYFTEQVLADMAAGLGPLGTPVEFVETGHNLRGGMAFRAYRIRAGSKTLDLTVRVMPDGKIEQCLIDRSS